MKINKTTQPEASSFAHTSIRIRIIFLNKLGVPAGFYNILFTLLYEQKLITLMIKTF